MVFSKAWNWGKGAVNTVGSKIGGIWKSPSNPLRAAEISTPWMNEERFEMGRGRERHSSEAMADRYQGQADAFGDRSSAAQARGRSSFATEAGSMGSRSYDRSLMARQAMLDESAQQGPSQAQAQLQAGQDQAMRQQVALARSGRGLGGESAAMRTAARSNADIQAQTNQQAAMLRAQEQQAWQAQRLGVLGQVQGQDQAMAQYGTGTAMQGDIQQRAMNDQREAALIQAQLGSQGMTNQMLGTELAAQQAYESQLGQMRTDSNIARANVQQQHKGGMGGLMAAGIGAAAMFSDERSKEQIESLRSQNEELRKTLAALGPSRSTGVPQQGGGYAQLGQQLGGLAARALSDREAEQERERQGAQGAGRAAYEAMGVTRGPAPKQAQGQRPPEYAALGIDGRDGVQMVREAPGYTYQYRDPDQPGAAPGQQWGPMAQDLERTELGKTLVTDTPDGKMVDTGRAALAGLAASAEQQRELDELKRKDEERERELQRMRTQMAAMGQGQQGAAAGAALGGAL